MPELVTTCRRCSECPNSVHHWLDYVGDMDVDSPTHSCKHCDAVGHECPACDGEGIVTRFAGDRDYETGCNLCGGDGVLFVRFEKRSE